MDDDFKRWIKEWFERLMERFDKLDDNVEDLSGRYNFLEGERLLDNQDVCQLLHVSKRTLQRYRSLGELPYHTIYHKTYYRESDVAKFIKTHFSNGKYNKPDDGDSKEE